MIDGWGVLSNALWIVGLSILLASWSMAYYKSRRSEQRVGEIFRREDYAWATTVGFVLFCAGLAATESRIWARVLWVVLSIAFLGERVYAWWQGSQTLGTEATGEKK
ncbi:MAG: hypothetical protein ACP5GX_03015 [Anaerolineae bacterium]